MNKFEKFTMYDDDKKHEWSNTSKENESSDCSDEDIVERECIEWCRNTDSRYPDSIFFPSTFYNK